MEMSYYLPIHLYSLKNLVIFTVDYIEIVIATKVRNGWPCLGQYYMLFTAIRGQTEPFAPTTLHFCKQGMAQQTGNCPLFALQINVYDPQITIISVCI